MRRLAGKIVVGGLLVALTTLVGCGGEGKDDTAGASSTPAGSKGVIAFSALSLKNPFFATIAETMKQDAEKAGFTFEYHDAEENVEKQANHIDNYILKGVTAIVINPADRKAIGPAIKKANAAGIPVFTNDLQCVAEGIEIAGHAGTDNEQGGELAGAAMIEVLGESGGEVAILHYQQAHSCVLRVKGFRTAIDAHNKENPDSQIKIVAEVEGGGARGKSLERAAGLLTAHKNLAAIFAINDPSALGAYTALEQANRVGEVTIIGFDGALAGKKAIRDGKIYADPIQFPKKMAHVTIENIVKYLEGEDFEKVQLFPTALYRKSDAESDPDLQ